MLEVGDCVTKMLARQRPMIIQDADKTEAHEQSGCWLLVGSGPCEGHRGAGLEKYIKDRGMVGGGDWKE